MDGPLRAIAYGSIGLLALSVILDAIDDLALGGHWDGATTVLAGVVTASLTALVTYQAKRRNGNGKEGKP